MYFTYNCAAILHSYHSSSCLKSFFLYYNNDDQDTYGDNDQGGDGYGDDIQWL